MTLLHFVNLLKVLGIRLLRCLAYSYFNYAFYPDPAEPGLIKPDWVVVSWRVGGMSGMQDHGQYQVSTTGLNPSLSTLTNAATPLRCILWVEG